ncbi:hypothetical protein ACFC4G_44470 [Streptomyces sp. NPDC056002]|uniref:hypothetical protein n=1 Tax=Streptomyces sp. NPDC056002 TaxID=3345675 RepID=UPI0035DC3054
MSDRQSLVLAARRDLVQAPQRVGEQEAGVPHRPVSHVPYLVGRGLDREGDLAEDRAGVDALVDEVEGGAVDLDKERRIVAELVSPLWPGGCPAIKGSLVFTP